MKRQLLILVIIVLLFAVSTTRAQEIFEPAKSGDLIKIKELIEANPRLIMAKDESGRTPLHWTARGVHFEALQYLVEKGADVNAQDANGTTALHSAAAGEAFPLVSTDGKFFFFCREGTQGFNPYWVDLGFIKNLRPKESK